jgi:hypothetical protein
MLLITLVLSYVLEWLAFKGVLALNALILLPSVTAREPKGAAMPLDKAIIPVTIVAQPLAIGWDRVVVEALAVLHDMLAPCCAS